MDDQWMEEQAQRCEDLWEEHVAELESCRVLLGELLAVIHRDGGHYADEHGWLQATEDAIRIHRDLLVKVNQ